MKFSGALERVLNAELCQFFLTVFVRILRMNRFYCVVTYFSILFLALPSVCLSIMSLSVYPSLSLSVYLSVCLGTRMFSLTIVKKYWIFKESYEQISNWLLEHAFKYKYEDLKAEMRKHSKVKYKCEEKNAYIKPNSSYQKMSRKQHTGSITLNPVMPIMEW